MDADILFESRTPLPESGVHWFETYVSSRNDVLRMKSAGTDPCLLFCFNEKETLDGLVCLYVDDSFGAGSEHFLTEEDKASKAFTSKGQNLLKDAMEITFNEQHFKMENGNVFAHQKAYINCMPTENVPRNSSSFMSRREQVAYVSNCTRQVIACAVNKPSQDKETEAVDPDFKRLDDIFSRIKAEDFRLRCGNVDIDTSGINFFADASLATSMDLSSQLAT